MKQIYKGIIILANLFVNIFVKIFARYYINVLLCFIKQLRHKKMKTQKISKFHRKLILSIYGINGLINLKAGLTFEGDAPKFEIDYNN